MATPPGPASPGNPISYDNIRAEVNFTPNIDIGLYDFATYIYDDGFINDYTFYPAFYPLPSSPAGGAVTQNASISMFYGSPTTFPGLLTTGAIINVANGGTVYIRVS